MACKLCLLDAPLAESHIIPEFLFRPSYDDKHRALHFNRVRSKESLIQKGWREALLCSACEQHLSSLERWFANSWVSGSLVPNPIAVDGVQIRGLDFSKFKLFHLSILWRAAVASTPPFGGIQLGTHQEAIRNAILGLNAPDASNYELFGFILRHPETMEVMRSIVVPPTNGTLASVPCYGTVFGGAAWYYFMPGIAPPLPPSLRLTDSGSIWMGAINFTEYGMLKKFMEPWRLRREAEVRGRPSDDERAG